MKFSRRWLCSGFLLATTNALATRAPGSNPRDRARAAFAEGMAAFQRGEYQNALRLFLEAQNLVPRAQMLFNIAMCYERLQDARNAILYYQQFLQSNPSPTQRTEVEQRIARLRS